MNIQTSSNGSLYFNEDYRSLLEHSGIRNAADLWNLSGETVKKVLKERGTERIYLTAPDGRRIETYLKRNTAPPVRQIVKDYFSLKFKEFNAMDEWKSLLRFHEKDLPTMVPIAAAETGGGTCCLTLGLQNCTRASDLLAHSEPKDPIRRELILKIAHLAASMHQAGMSHQDFYLVHIFVRPEEANKIYLIDLQRVIRETDRNDRWIIKDLGQMIFSMTAASLTMKEILLFCHEYKRERGLLNDSGRKLIRRSFLKARKIQARDRKKLEEKKVKFGLQ